jgi:hypothetical protein
MKNSQEKSQNTSSCDGSNVSKNLNIHSSSILCGHWKFNLKRKRKKTGQFCVFSNLNEKLKNL